MGITLRLSQSYNGILEEQMMAFGKWIEKAVGSLACIGIGLSALGVAAIYYAGSFFVGAAAASSAMITKGYFDIKMQWSVYSPINAW